MHEQTTKGIHEEEVPKLMYTISWCKPVQCRKPAKQAHTVIIDQ